MCPKKKLLGLCRRPVEFLLHLPAVDDVTHQIDRVAVAMIKEIDQQFCVAPACAQMDVADPDRAIVAAS